MSYVSLTDEQRAQLRDLALKQLHNAGADALAKFVDGKLTLDELEDVLALLARGSLLVGEHLVDLLVQLPEPYETASDQGIRYVFDLAADAVERLVRKIIRNILGSVSWV